MDEGGNVRFLVYGYQNRGDHEGEIAAVVYYYDSVLNIVEEEMSVPYTGSAEMLEADIQDSPELWLWTHIRWSRTKQQWEERQKQERNKK